EGAPAPFAPVASDTVPGLLLTGTGDDQGVFGAGDFDVVAAHPGEVAANQQIVLPHEDIGGRAPGLRSGTRPCQFVAGRRIGDAVHFPERAPQPAKRAGEGVTAKLSRSVQTRLPFATEHGRGSGASR